jgi:ornithine cyclodeaminase/alanine dehydrogenase-like protein (mu-crystallin family)
MPMTDFYHFTKEDIRKKIPMRKAIDLMRMAFLQLSAGGAMAPVRTVIDSRDRMGRALFMPSYSPSFGLFGLKMVTVFDNNEAVNLPVIQGKMLVMDGVKGIPLAMLDAEYLTALRTGAASGLATDLLARKDAETLAIFGTGAQAETQLQGVLSVRPVKNILVYGKTEKRTASFCHYIQEKLTVDIRPGGLEELKNADIICTATTSPTPVFQQSQIKNGVHINGIGSYKPTTQEISSETIAQSMLVVDQRQAALSEAGDVIIPIQQGLITENHIHAELGEIVSGYKKGRTTDEQITVFKSVGNAMQDLAVAHYMLQG